MAIHAVVPTVLVRQFAGTRPSVLLGRFDVMSAVPAVGSIQSPTCDLFVSYAHADNEVPRSAQFGWVTTLVDSVQKVLRRKLGGAGADVWMDHQLAANQPVTQELLQRASSRGLLQTGSGDLRRPQS